MTTDQKIKAINKIISVIAIHYDKKSFAMQFKVPLGMTFVNPMFQGFRTITFARFVTLKRCVDNEYSRIVLKKKVKGGSIDDNLVNIRPCTK